MSDVEIRRITEADDEAIEPAATSHAVMDHFYIKAL